MAGLDDILAGEHLSAFDRGQQEYEVLHTTFFNKFDELKATLDEEEQREIRNNRSND